VNKEQGKQFKMLPTYINFTSFNHLQSFAWKGF